MPWFHWKRDASDYQPMGPYSAAQLLAEVRVGRLEPSTLVRDAVQTQGNWVELRSVDFLRAAFEQHAHGAAETEFLNTVKEPPSASASVNRAGSATRPPDDPRHTKEAVWLPRYATDLWIFGLTAAGVLVLRTWVMAIMFAPPVRPEFAIWIGIEGTARILFGLVLWRMAIDALVLLFQIRESLERQEKRERS